MQSSARDLAFFKESPDKTKSSTGNLRFSHTLLNLPKRSSVSARTQKRTPKKKESPKQVTAVT